MAASEQSRLLILRALGLGDFLTSLPALRALAASFVGHRRILATPAELQPLAEMSGAIDLVVPAAPLEPLPDFLSGVDVAVNLHGKGPESHRIILALNPERVIWFENPEVPESLGSPIWRPDEHEVHRWCRLLQESGIPADPRRLELTPPPPAAESARGATILHPGASSAARRWPLDRWAHVARYEAGSGRRVIITGNAAERPDCLVLARLAGLEESCVHAGLTDLAELASLVKRAARLVCGDTGVAHLATAVGTPSVLLFGPVSPALWGPPSDRPEHKVIWKGTDGQATAESATAALDAITPDDVLEAMSTLPTRRSWSSESAPV